MRRIATTILALLTLGSSTPAMCHQCQFVQPNAYCGTKHGIGQTLRPAHAMNVTMSRAHCEHENAALAQSQRDGRLDLFSLGSLQFPPCKQAPEVATDIRRFDRAQFSDSVTVPVRFGCQGNGYQAVRVDLNVEPSQHPAAILLPSISLRI